MSEVVIILLGTSLLYVFASSRMEAFVKTLSFQGFLLFLLVISDIHDIFWMNIAFLLLETLVIKTLVIPALLLKILRRHDIAEETPPSVSQFHPLLAASAIFIFGFVVAFWAARMERGVHPLYFGVSITLIIGSLFLIINRKSIFTHILCYMMLENGIFLLSLSVANDMPLLVNLGVLLDLFVGVYLLAIFFNRIQSVYDGGDIDALTQLKD
jgi:hydrogenase-4 component E